MTLKASFASVLRALRSKRNITQRDFADTTSRTYLSKLELGKSSITLDKLDQVSRRLELSPLTLLTLTLCEDNGKPPSELISKLQLEIADLQREDGLPGLRAIPEMSHQMRRLPRRAISGHESNSMQAELTFAE
ncbi:helix-turn-helix domain-containing protein [Pseudomonas sp. CJQ_13]|uniref:helix-turn-helix domain-containing protein n=1 Tax=Pseudomonas sp. CJQ_13 TaxID=3367170 RepID=UPI00370BF725